MFSKTSEALVQRRARDRGTGFQPVLHGQEAHATRGFAKASSSRFLPLLLAAAFSVSARGAPAPLRVVTTIPDLAAIAAAVGGQAVTVTSIAQGHENPHFLQARPTYIVQARDADLWIRAGAELEVGWEPIVLDQARNRRIQPGQPGFLDGSAHVPVLREVPEGPVSRAQGDVHPSGNPHYLLDPLNARAIARAIGARLAALRPEQAAQFEAGADAFVRELDRRLFGADALAAAPGDALAAQLEAGTLDDWAARQNVTLDGWWAELAPWRGRQLVTFHKSFTYFTQRFGLEVASELEPVPGVPPGPAHLARVMQRMQDEQIGLILMEPFYPRKPADFVAARTAARVAVVSSYAPDTQPEAYFRLIEAIIAAIKGP
ncbi:MAG: metal ABC transporter substrate-binding protein [Candidatus Marinimicrobia bacterium]|nr:metal ABC transporter substrate-binding protein [Candidatus Neomarinimicrobiota bacterium]